MLCPIKTSHLNSEKHIPEMNNASSPKSFLGSILLYPPFARTFDIHRYPYFLQVLD